MHNLSQPSVRTNTGMVIEFFLRAIRIYSNEFVMGEIAYVSVAFQKLMYHLSYYGMGYTLHILQE